MPRPGGRPERAANAATAGPTSARIWWATNEPSKILAGIFYGATFDGTPPQRGGHTGDPGTPPQRGGHTGDPGTPPQRGGHAGDPGTPPQRGGHAGDPGLA